MKFEGNQVNIPIKGIMRAGTDELCADGAMNEVIGMEYKDGSWLPYSMTEEGVIFTDMNLDGGIKKVYVHKTSDGESHYIVITTNNSLFYEINRVGSDKRITLSLLTDSVKDVEILGNMLCVSKDSGMENYIWNSDTNRYKTYSNQQLIEQLPKIIFAVSNNDANKTSEGQYNSGQILYARSNAYGKEFYNTLSIYGSAYLEESKVRESVAGAARKAQYSVQENGRLYGCVLTCYAYRLKNGDLIMASSPVLLNFPNINSELGDVSDDGLANHKVYIPKSALLGKESTLKFRRSVNSDNEWYADSDFMYDEEYRKVDNGMFAMDKSSDTGVLINTFEKMPPLYAYYHDVHSYEYNDAGFVVAGCVSNFLKIKILSDIPSELKNLVQSVCIFMSEQVNPYEDFTHQNTTCIGSLKLSPEGDYSASYRFKLKSREGIYDEILKLKNLYLVNEIPFNSIKESESFEVVDLRNKLGDSLLVQESLPIEAFNLRENISGELSTYNYRLHLSQYTQRLFKGYDFNITTYIPMCGQLHYGTEYEDVEEESYIKVTIDNEEGHSEVWSKMSSHPSVINPIIAYPDADATSIEFYVESGGEWYMKHYDLTPSASGNFAFHLEPDLDVSGPWGGQREKVNAPTIEDINNLRTYHNGLKVSDVAYPSYFPAKYTYRIGNEKIIGLARLTIPVSQDNYGVDRLIVFCTDGIYSMGVDRTGAGVYTDTQYVNPEVCVNRNTICEIGGAIIFASDKGLMMLSSNGVEEFIPHLNGKIRFKPSDDAVSVKDGNHIYNKIVNNYEIVELKDSLSTDDFIDYISDIDTVVSYVSKKNKIVIYNKFEQYIYLIDIKTRNTTKLDVRIDFDDDNSPEETYWLDIGGEWRPLVFCYLSDEIETDCLIQSRPIKIQQDDKCSYRCVLTGYFEGNPNSNQWAELVVLGSLDGDHWRAIGVKERKLNEPFHNFGCITERGSWKYVMFIFAGRLSHNSHIDSIDITVDGRYNNKKR